MVSVTSKTLECQLFTITLANKGDAAKVMAHDLRFHRTICEMSGHRKLIFWEMLEHHISMFLTIEKKSTNQPKDTS